MLRAYFRFIGIMTAVVLAAFAPGAIYGFVVREIVGNLHTWSDLQHLLVVAPAWVFGLPLLMTIGYRLDDGQDLGVMAGATCFFLSIIPFYMVAGG